MLSRRDAAGLVKLLDRAALAVGEHAVEQSWRADAMHAVKERLVEGYHRNRHADALDTIAALKAARADLAARIERADDKPPAHVEDGPRGQRAG